MNDKLQPCLKDVFEGREVMNPVFQVVEIKEMPSKDGTSQRFKFAISDGVNFCPAMLSSQLSHLVTDNKLEKFQLIRVKEYNPVKNKLLILLEVEVLPEKFSDVIGNPSSIASKGNPSKEESQNQREESNENSRENNHLPPPPQKKAMAPPVQPQPKPARPPTSSQYLSINSLTPYIPSWTILARVIQKVPIKEWSNSRSHGQLFSIVLKDKQGGEIRGTFFNDEVERFKDKIELDKVYAISGGRLKAANQKYSNVNHEYEITFDKTTTFTEASDAEGESIGEISYNFTKLKEVGNKEINSYVDVIAVISEVHPSEEIHSNKTNKAYQKRTIILTDDSNATIECTLWGEEAINFPSNSDGQVIRIKSAKVGEFHGKNISTSPGSVTKLLDHSDPKAAELYEWYENNKDNISSFDNISSGSGGGDYQTQMIYLDEINTENLGSSEKQDYFCVYVILKEIPMNRNIYYLACPNPECRNKGVSSEGEKYVCPNCHKVIEDPVPRYAFTALFWDFSGQAYFSVMGDDNGKNIIGISADEWKQQVEEVEDSDRSKLVRPLFFKHFKLRGRARTESYNSEQRIKLTVQTTSEIDYADAAKFFAEEIRKF